MSKREKLARSLLKDFGFFFSLSGAKCSRGCFQVCPSVPGPDLQQLQCPVPHKQGLFHSAVSRYCYMLVQQSNPETNSPVFLATLNPDLSILVLK